MCLVLFSFHGAAWVLQPKGAPEIEASFEASSAVEKHFRMTGKQDKNPNPLPLLQAALHLVFFSSP